MRSSLPSLCARRAAIRPPALAVLLLVVLVAPLAGCASSNWVTLRKSPHNPLTEQLSLLDPRGPQPTERTVLLLRRYDLEKDLGGDPTKLLGNMRAVMEREPSADKLYSIAEVAYLSGKKAEMTNQARGLELHGAAVLNSYLYLFDERFGRWRNAYDPEFRGACDLYNEALESAMRIVKKQGGLKPGHTAKIETADQTMEVMVVVRGNGWRAEDFDHFEFVSDYEIKGLKNQYHTYGLGVPLIAVRKKHASQAATERYFPPGLSFPVTAFLRLLPQDGASLNHHVALLELYDPLTTADIPICGRRVPLESDLSTPLAYCLSRKELTNLDLATAGLLRPDETLKAKGLYMLEPYAPGKIPVLMVHGLWSSPSTWMEMFNDLRSDPEIRSRYQFWFYFYPSGQPFWYSAAQLREDLAGMRQTLDPQHREVALDQMVLVGHSMGGLISRMQTIDSGDNFWRMVSDEPFESIKAEPEIRQSLYNTYYFKANPAVRRVVTIGTPHRGSKFANSTVRYLGSKIISLPKMLVSDQKQLAQDNPGKFLKASINEVPTSLDSLSPKCPIFPVMLETPTAAWVKYHNVVGHIPDKGLIGKVAGGSDGVVSVSSAHLDNVTSEIEVDADHLSIHRHPSTVYEVRRILLEHLLDLNTSPRNKIDRLPWVAEALPGDFEPRRRGGRRVVPASTAEYESVTDEIRIGGAP